MARRLGEIDVIVRLVGFVGVLALLPINLIGLYLSALEHNIKGVVLMVLMAMMLAFFVRVLWQGMQCDRGCTDSRLIEGPLGESVNHFFSHVVLRSVEGRIYLAGALASVVMAVFSYLWPEAIGILQHRRLSTVALFTMWPICAFVWYVKVCGPDFRTGTKSEVLVALGSAFPFWVVFV